MTRTRTEIAADLRTMGPAAIRRLDGLVCEAVAELLDPHVERPEPLLSSATSAANGKPGR